MLRELTPNPFRQQQQQQQQVRPSPDTFLRLKRKNDELIAKVGVIGGAPVDIWYCMGGRCQLIHF